MIKCKNEQVIYNITILDLDKSLYGNMEEGKWNKIECFFNSSTRLTAIPTQVLCQCTGLKALKKLSNEKPNLSQKENGKINFGVAQTDK